MKCLLKIVWVIIILTICLPLFSCSDSPTTTTSPVITNTETTNTATPTTETATPTTETATPTTETTTPTTTGSLDLVATFHNIGVYANFSGDDNDNNSATMRYRETGGDWKTGMDLTVDRRATVYSSGSYQSNPYADQWRGSVLSVSANTEYEVEVTFADTDGITGDNPVTNTITTRSETFALGSGSTYYVATDGDDGAAGLEAIKKEGGKTIAESEETCVVYGMPKAAVKRGAANLVLPNYQVKDYMINFARKNRFNLNN